MKVLLRTLVRVLEGLAIAFVLVAAVVFIQLARGPLPLDPFVPYVESSLNRLVPDYVFSIADADLNWKRLTRRPELTVANVQVRDKNGQAIAAFGSLDVSLDIPELIGGRLVIEHLGISRPVVRIVRAADGKVSLGVEASTTSGAAAVTPDTQAGEGQQSGVARLLIDALRVSPDDAESGPALESVDITQTTIVVVDEPSGVQWLIPDANLRLLGQRETIEIAAKLPLLGGSEKVNVDVAGRYTYAAGLLSLTASFDGLRPAAFAGVAALLEPLKAIDAAVKGTVEVNLVPDNLNSDTAWGSISLSVGAGTLALPEQWGGTVAMSGAELKAATSGGLDQIALEKAEVRLIREDGLSPTISATGRANNLRTQPDVDIQAKIDALTLQALKDLWPTALAPNTRGWIVDNLNGGTIKGVTAAISLAGTEAWTLAPETLNLRADVDGVVVTYIKGMPKVERASGVLNVGLKEVIIDVTGGVVPDAVSGQGLRVGNSKLRMFDLESPIPKADFAIKVTGDLGEALRLIDNEPLKYASKMQVDPNTASGNADVDLSLKFPLLSKLSLDELQIGVKAKVTDTRIGSVLFGMPLTDGDLALDVVNTGLAVSGTASLGPIRTGLTWTQDFGTAEVRSQYALDALVANEDRPLVQLGFAPFIPPNIDGLVRTEVVYRTMRDGSATLNAEGDLTDVAMAIPELGWSKAPGVKASFEADVTLQDGALVAVPRFNVIAENDFDVAGAVTFGPQNALKTLKITKGKAGKTDLRLDATKDEAGHYTLNVTGPVFDASYFWKDLNKDESRGGTVDEQPVTAEGQAAQPDQIPVTLTANIGEMWLAKDSPLKDVSLLFDRNRRVIQKVDLKSKVESGAAFDFALVSKDGVRTLSGNSTDGGGVVKSLGLFDDIKGGALAITGTVTPAGAVEGKAEISEFKLVEAPMVARILSVAALTGIADELRGQGISFKTLSVPFAFSSSTLRITDAEMFGSSLGLTAQGSYRFSDTEIDMEGTVIPAYALNTALNAIPIVGTLLTGTEKGGGIFAANFSWRGPSATAEPSVNPLSVLTPGITRKIFSIFGGGSSTPKPPAAAPVPPAKQR
jgi:Protein of unknown function/AsmA-like C-terminal region